MPKRRGARKQPGKPDERMRRRAARANIGNSDYDELHQVQEAKMKQAFMKQFTLFQEEFQEFERTVSNGLNQEKICLNSKMGRNYPMHGIDCFLANYANFFKTPKARLRGAPRANIGPVFNWNAGMKARFFREKQKEIAGLCIGFAKFAFYSENNSLVLADRCFDKSKKLLIELVSKFNAELKLSDAGNQPAG